LTSRSVFGNVVRPLAALGTAVSLAGGANSVVYSSRLLPRFSVASYVEIDVGGLSFYQL